MKLRMMAYTTVMTLFSMMAGPARLAAQSNALQGFSYKVLYTFTGGTDGAIPFTIDLIRDEQGNLYGTTWVGGDLSECPEHGGSGNGCGVVFKVDPQGNYTVLYPFTGTPDGAVPEAGLLRDAGGNLYGTTSEGGSLGDGTVFTLDSTGNERVMYSFTGGPDGENPDGALLIDANGNLYGVALGGSAGNGVVFKLDRLGTLTPIHTFQNGTDGRGPYGDLIWDPAGHLYGTTTQGGLYGGGTVYELSPQQNGTWDETILYNFTGGADGNYPVAGVIRDDDGNLYGTTQSGGTSGNGVVFKVDMHGNESVLYSFTGGTDGGFPQADLVRDQHGNLYGTTLFGGVPGGCGGGPGYCGVVFKLDTAGRETVLYAFTGQADGQGPNGLLRDQNGNLYGTTENGGDLGSQQGWCFGAGCGVVFKISACHTAICHGEDERVE